MRCGGGPNGNNSDGVAPLHVAARAGDAGAIMLLLVAGAHWDAKTYDCETPLYMAMAAEYRHVGVVRLLLVAGADPNDRGALGRTALHHAVSGEWHTDAVALLLQYGADAGIKDDYGESPFEVACVGRDVPVVALMLDVVGAG